MTPLTKNYVKFDKYQYHIELSSYEIYTAKQISFTKTVVRFYNILILIYGCICLFSLLTGGVDLLKEILNLMQNLSYLSLINLKFPYNIQQSFEAFYFYTISNISKYLFSTYF